MIVTQLAHAIIPQSSTTNASRFRVLSYVQLFAALLGVFYCVAISWWLMPKIRPKFVPDLPSFLMVTFTAALLVFMGLCLIIAIWRYRTQCSRLLSWWLRKGLIPLALFLAGALLLSEWQIAPPVEQWLALDDPVLVFFGLYTAALMSVWVVWLLLKTLLLALMRWVTKPVDPHVYERFGGVARLLYQSLFFYRWGTDCELPHVLCRHPYVADSGVGSGVHHQRITTHCATHPR